MTRKERIALHLQLGLSVVWLESLSDEEFDNQVAFAEEGELRVKADYGKGKPALRPVNRKW